MNPRGAVGGGQIGYNWQTSSVVWGVVADFQASDMKNTQTVSVPALGVFFPKSIGFRPDRLVGTVRGRLGWAGNNNFMPYVSGGFAYGETKSTLNLFVPASGFVMTGSNNTTRAGWTIGGGVDYAVTPNVIIGVDFCLSISAIPT